MTTFAVATSTIALCPVPGAATAPAALLAMPAAAVLDIAVRPVRAGRTGPPVPTEHLLRACRLMPPGHPDRACLRARAIEDNLPLAHRMARRYAGRGERLDDLTQVAALALITAVDGYDPAHTAPFVSYAIPTMLGALKRHFRDSAWGIRVPRSAQQVLLDLPAATADLTQVRGRSPTTAELAAYLKVSVKNLLAAMQAAQVYRLPSLNAALPGQDGNGEIGDLIGVLDPDYERVDERMSRESLRSLVAALPLRERRIVVMRFYDQMTQERIAEEIGISQMHVSRLLQRSLAELRIAYAAADAVAGTPSRCA